jgi:hypothetical protein
VEIEGLAADNTALPLGGPIALGPGRPRLEFRFTGLGSAAPERMRFRYRLDGFDPGPDWTEAGTQRVAFYTNLPPGDYAFRVRAANGDGVWNEQGATLRFTVRPHLWETGTFRALCVLALVLAGATAYQWRIRRIRALARELEARVKEAVAHIQTLKGLLPICASCKKIRDDGGYWNQIESYVSEHSGAEFSHSICPECMRKLYPDYAAAKGGSEAP